MRAIDGATLKLGKKYSAATPSSRPAVSVYLEQAEWQALATLPAAVLVKRRFDVPHEGARFVVDRFEGTHAGLWLAEVEAADAPALARISAPLWCSDEVTADPRYGGGALALAGGVPG